jgi:uncharacterized protein YjbI with pentapeptide repeats
MDLRTSTRRRFGAALAIAVIAGACSGGGGDSGGGTAPATSAVSPTNPTDPPTTDSAPAPPVTEPAPAAPNVPAGVNWMSTDAATPDSTAPLPTFEEVNATAGVPSPPPGYPFRQSTYTAQRWDRAGVTFVSGGCSCWEGGNDVGVFGNLANPQYLFRSEDGGSSWSQVDLAPALGSGNGNLDDIVEVGGSLFLQASISEAINRPSNILVAKSDDRGVTWTRTATITGDFDGRMSLFGGRFGQVGENLVIVGGDVVCDFDGSTAIQAIGVSLQQRLWTSSDGGATWIAQSKADTALDTKPTPPADDAGCQGFDLEARMEQYQVIPRTIDFENGMAFVWSPDGARIATSSDGLTWTTATLEGATAVPSELSDGAANSDAAAVYAADGGFAAANVEIRRTADDEATSSSSDHSVVVWTSPDGISWERQPLGRPIRGGFGSFELLVTDSGLELVESEYDSALRARVPVNSWVSVAGPFEDWQTCDAQANANCSFAEEVIGIEPGDDLSGIDLSNVVLDGVDLTDVSFVGARLVGAGIINSVLDGADFSNANLTFTSVNGDVTNAVFAGALINNAFVNGGFFAADLTGATLTRLRISLDEQPLPPGTTFAGQDLTGWSFDGFTKQGDLAGIDFSGANLTDASFSGVDLTGANLTGANVATVFFSNFGDFPVICPDGLPLDDTQFGPAACRLLVL